MPKLEQFRRLRVRVNLRRRVADELRLRRQSGPSRAEGQVGFKLPVRLEYIGSTGSAAGGAPNLLYGPGSAAWSFTVTPTYQYKRFFARAEDFPMSARARPHPA
ncbi:outer membrane beta-barrel protein [Cupriavidus basilensis]